MRVAIVGSRDFPKMGVVRAFVQSLDLNVVVISGGARGVDTVAVEEARECGLEVEEINAEWDEIGRAAGPLRNTKIVDRADIVVAFWDGRSSGTRDTIKKARAAGKLMCVFKRSKDG